VFASLTTKENAEHVKKWSVFLTAITAALASVQSTFHIRENIGTFIKATVDLNQLQADYLAERASFADELKSKDAFKPDTQKKLLELHRVYTLRYNVILNDRMHAWSNVGQQSLRSSIPAIPSPPSPASPSSPGSATANVAR
jgi:hypothetical protein